MGHDGQETKVNVLSIQSDLETVASRVGHESAVWFTRIEGQVMRLKVINVQVHPTIKCMHSFRPFKIVYDDEKKLLLDKLVIKICVFDEEL